MAPHFPRKSNSKFAKRMALLLAPVVVFMGCLPACKGPTDANANSADRMIFWANCSEVVKLSNAQLDEWKRRGVDGFVCVHQHLWGLGGSQQFDRNPDSALAGKTYELQRSLRDSRIVERARKKGMKMYLGFYLDNAADNSTTPLLDWFDDAGWTQKVLPATRDIVGAADLLGFDGVAFDQELYRADEAAQNWPWNYPGSTRSEPEVRSKVAERGRQTMRAMLEVFPDLDLLTYAYSFEGDWKSVVQLEYNDTADFGTRSTFVDWYDGLSSVEGYSAIRLFSTAFYKQYAPARDWDTALTHEFNSIYSRFSRRLSNWSYAAPRIHLAPAIWIDNGDSTSSDGYDSAHPPADVETQLQAMRRWGAGREFVIFAYHGLYGTSSGGYRDAFDYDPYVPSMKRASTPIIVDTSSPWLAVTSPTNGPTFHTEDREIELEGVAGDNMALRAVSWENERGGHGAAQTDWQVRCGDHRTGYESQLTWTTGNIQLDPGENRIVVTAEDIKGLQVTHTVTVVSGSSTATPDETDPTVRLSSPSCNTVASEPLTVSAEATDNVGVTRVEFLLDGTVAATVTSPPYDWEWDPHVTGAGARTLAARAYDAGGRTATASIPVTVQPPASQFTIARAATPPVVDGDLTEYAAATAAVFGPPSTTNTVTARAMWDPESLYLAYDVEDTDLNASDAGRDGTIWEDDSVEWFVDVDGDGGGSGARASPHMSPDDHQGIVNAANVQFDARGSGSGTPDPAWDGAWTSHVVTRGSPTPGAEGDAGYTVEIRVPWASLGVNTGPQAGSTVGLGLAVNDKDASGVSSVMWPDVAAGFQNAGNWHLVTLVGTPP